MTFIEFISKDKFYLVDKSKKIGEGAFGNVYVGEDEDGNKLAVKILKSKGRETFDEEVKCLKKVVHICKKVDVVCLIDSFEVELRNKKYHIIVTPLYENYKTLFDFTERYHIPITESMADEIYSKIERVITELERLRIEHSDLHTGNILIHPENGITNDKKIDVKVIDFGLCSDIKPNKNPFRDRNSLSAIRERLDISVMKSLLTPSDLEEITKRGMDPIDFLYELDSQKMSIFNYI
jgi:serine/threonine protein kinase